VAYIIAESLRFLQLQLTDVHNLFLSLLSLGYSFRLAISPPLNQSLNESIGIANLPNQVSGYS
jgi:hypothetical protein